MENMGLELEYLTVHLSVRLMEKLSAMLLDKLLENLMVDLSVRLMENLSVMLLENLMVDLSVRLMENLSVMLLDNMIVELTVRLMEDLLMENALEKMLAVKLFVLPLHARKVATPQL